MKRMTVFSRPNCRLPALAFRLDQHASPSPGLQVSRQPYYGTCRRFHKANLPIAANLWGVSRPPGELAGDYQIGCGHGLAMLHRRIDETPSKHCIAIHQGRVMRFRLIPAMAHGAEAPQLCGCEIHPASWLQPLIH
jgi:hypothetical protein